MTDINIIKEIMHQPNNIRNISVIAHVDHGKSTLTDTLISGAGKLRLNLAGESNRKTDKGKQEKERGITIDSTGISLCFPWENDESLLPPESEGDNFLVNLIDSPGHVDFSSEVTAALRVTDGALVVVDCIEGVCIQTETVLRQALVERIKPVLIINKIDKAFQSLQIKSEDLYKRFVEILEKANQEIETYLEEGVLSENMDDILLDPRKGNVGFAAGLQGWCFSLPQFARFYASKTNVSYNRWIKRFWGDLFVDEDTGKWGKNQYKKNDDGTTKELKRGFCYLIDEIRKIFTLVEDKNNTKSFKDLQKKMKKLAVKIPDDLRDLPENQLIRYVMREWLPAHKAIVEMIVLHLPSAVKAQTYRSDKLYTGESDDDISLSIKACNPEGPLVVYVSKMVQQPGSKRFFAFGRVFSGTARSGIKVNIMGPNYQFGKMEDYYKNVPVHRCVIMQVDKASNVDEVPVGNIVCLSGVDKFLTKSGTLSDDPNCHPFKNMKHVIAPVVKIAVETKNPKDIVKLKNAMNQLNSIDILVECTTNDQTGEYLIAGAGELHLEVCFEKLKEILGENVPIIRSQPVVSYCETVSSVSEITCLVKSSNKHNRLFGQAEPLDEDIVKAVDSKLFDPTNLNPNEMKTYLTENHGWSSNEAKKLWFFAPEEDCSTSKTNAVVDTTHGVQNLHEIKDSVRAAFDWISKIGVLTQEPIRGVRFNITDCMLHADTIHRGGGQIIPAARKFFYACMLSANIRLMEPIYLISVSCNSVVKSKVYSVINSRRAVILNEIYDDSNPLVEIRAQIPVAESFNIVEDLRAKTSGDAFTLLSFSHWETIQSDPFEENSRANKIVKEIRERKGLSPTLPKLDDFNDRL